LELALKEADNVQKQAMSEIMLATLKDTVLSQRNRIIQVGGRSEGSRDRAKSQARSAQLAAKDNSVALLARVNGGKNELNKAKRNLLGSRKSLSKALKSGSAKGKQVLALQLAKIIFETNLPMPG
jgi:hypothetical protein